MSNTHRLGGGKFRYRFEKAPRRPFGDLYHSLLRMGWLPVIGLGLLAYFAGNLVFAALFVIGGDTIEGARPGDFGDAFFFSVQTVSTIGYGAMSPKTPYAHLLVTLASFFGLVGVALATGLVFAKFARPIARVTFADRLVVHPRHGVPCLMLRVVNERTTPILSTSFELGVLVDEVTPEGERMRRNFTLELVRPRISIFAIGMTLIHQLDEASPLHGLTPKNIDERLIALIVEVHGTDGTLLQQVSAHRLYGPEDVVFGHRYRDMVEGVDGDVIVAHFDRISETLPFGAVDPTQDPEILEE